MNPLRWMLPAQLKQSATSRVILMALNTTEPVPHAPYGVLSREAYERNVVVHACVSEIAKAASSVPWFLMKEARAGKMFSATRCMTKHTARKSFMTAQNLKRGWAVKKALERTEVESHPLLAFIEKPNPAQAQAEYVAQQISYWLLSGNTYEEFLAPESGPNKGRPAEMYNLRPDRVRIIPAKDFKSSIVGGYLYELNNTKETFAPESVIHKRFFHPTNDWYGLSPLQVACRAYQTDNLSADWNYALLKNQARPGGALVVPTTLSDDTFERAKKELLESYSGDNIGAPALLEGGLKWEPMSMSPLEMDWLESRAYTRVEICSVFNVPPELVGDSSHKTYNSFPEARKAFWMEAVLPLLDAMRDAYNQRLVPTYGDALFLDYDRDQIDALSEDSTLVWDRVNRATHISFNEAREATGYDAFEDDEAANVPKGLLQYQQLAGLTRTAAEGEVPEAGLNGEVALPETSLNGAQVSSLIAVLQQVAAGQLPRDTGVAVITTAFNIDAALAEAIMGDLGRGFEPRAPVAGAEPPEPNPVKQQKSQQLSTAQKAALARLRRGMKDVFRGMGKELTAELKRIAETLQ